MLAAVSFKPSIISICLARINPRRRRTCDTSAEMVNGFHVSVSQLSSVDTPQLQLPCSFWESGLRVATRISVSIAETTCAYLCRTQVIHRKARLRFNSHSVMELQKRPEMEAEEWLCSLLERTKAELLM